MGIENIAATAFITPFLTAPSRGPIFHRGAPRYNWGAAPLPGCTGLTMKSVQVHPSQPEMQNLVGVEISALKSDRGALQAYEKGWYPYSKIPSE